MGSVEGGRGRMKEFQMKLCKKKEMGGLIISQFCLVTSFIYQGIENLSESKKKRERKKEKFGISNYRLLVRSHAGTH